jgi:hypothetical protein
VSRVLVNRIWLHHFGRGLVETPGDFGRLGTRPTHPELLDWLAAELVQQVLRLKRMHRLIMTSMVYRQSSRHDTTEHPGPVDVADALYARAPLRRLDAETLRDRVLAVSGRLDQTLFGPSVPIAEDSVGQVQATNDSPRRSLYLEVRRTKPVSFLAAFDAPVMAVNCERRIASTSAPQALMLMNSDFVLTHAQALARRLRSERIHDPPPPGTAQAALPRMIAHAWQVAYQRPISSEEMDWARALVAQQVEALGHNQAGGDRDLAVLTNLCQQLLTSNEFLYVD